jgi:hydroxyacyl-ACP dehydratase HTD2-like protein with hotdog domain
MSDALPPFTHAVTPESAGRWLAARDGAFAPPPAVGAALPLSYLCFLRVQPAAGISIHQALGRDPRRGLFGGVAYRAERAPRVGDVFDSRAEVRERRTVATPRGEMVLTTLEVTHRAADNATIVETVRMVDLPEGPPQAPTPGPIEATDLPRAADLKPVGAVQTAWMTVETGDMNPLHLDAAYAAERRFPAVVLPGPLMAALIEEAVTRAAGRAPTALSVRLRAASHPGEPLALYARQTAGAFRVHGPAGDLRAEGEATL